MNTLFLFKIFLYNKSRCIGIVSVIDESRQLAYLKNLQKLPEHDSWNGVLKRVARPYEQTGIVRFHYCKKINHEHTYLQAFRA